MQPCLITLTNNYFLDCEKTESRNKKDLSHCTTVSGKVSYETRAQRRSDCTGVV
jgi:hypothetical protein